MDVVGDNYWSVGLFWLCRVLRDWEMEREISE
jgi:hypothetical protein